MGMLGDYNMKKPLADAKHRLTLGMLDEFTFADLYLNCIKTLRDLRRTISHSIGNEDDMIEEHDYATFVNFEHAVFDCKVWLLAKSCIH